MNSRPNGFCQSLETVMGLAAVAAVWRDAMGSDWAWGRHLLRPMERLADCYPKREPGAASPLAYRIVWSDEAAGLFVGACPDGTGSIELRRADLVVYELDVAALARRLAEAMDLVFDYEEAAGVPHATRIGAASFMTEGEMWVYLVLRAGAQDLNDTLARLVARHDTPFVVLTPTRNAWGVRPANVRSRCQIIALDATFAVTPDGHWRAAEEVARGAISPGTAVPGRQPAVPPTGAATAYIPSPHEMAVLRVLAASKTTLVQEDITAAVDQAGHPLSRKTVGKVLRTLTSRGLVDFPRGKHAGARITDLGRAAATRSP